MASEPETNYRSDPEILENLSSQTNLSQQNRVHLIPFAMAFAIDWARANKDKDFENQLMEKAKYFFLKIRKHLLIWSRTDQISSRQVLKLQI
jgi:hypothetical protein